MARWIERLMPWKRTQREAQAARASAEKVTVETAVRKGRTDAVVRSVRERVYAENHISEAVVHLLTHRTHP
jgi:hypothetical protein